MSDPGGIGGRPPGRWRGRRIALWAGLIGASAAAVLVLKGIEAPAALLLGPLLVGVAFGVSGVVLKPAHGVKATAQALVGSIMGGALAAAYTPTFAFHLPLFMAIGVLSLAFSLGLGWMIARQGWIGGSTAVWGLAPGASAAMVSLAEANGGDVRVAGLMQYFRILMVAIAALTVAHFIAPGHSPHHSTSWFAPVDPRGLAAILALVAVGLATDRWTRIPAGALLIPSLLGSALQARGWIHIAAPTWLMAAAYAVIGWNIGLGFTKAALVQSARFLPRILAVIAVFLGLSALMAWPLIALAGVAPLTAYLATSPGGVDSILIIAASTPVDLPFILAAQTVRFLLVVMFGPPLMQAVVRRLAIDTVSNPIVG